MAEAKAQCHIDISNDDGLIAGYILSAREHLEDICNRSFLTQTWEQTFDFDWPWIVDTESFRQTHCRLIELKRCPLQSVTSITYVDPTGITQTLATNQYVVDTRPVIGRVYPAYGVTWPTVRSQRQAITVQFVAGWTMLPNPILQALRLLVGHYNENREAVASGSFIELPMAVDALISSYRVYF